MTLSNMPDDQCDMFRLVSGLQRMVGEVSRSRGREEYVVTGAADVHRPQKERNSSSDSFFLNTSISTPVTLSFNFTIQPTNSPAALSTFLHQQYGIIPAIDSWAQLRIQS